MDNAEYYRLPRTSDPSNLILGQDDLHYCRARVRNWYVPHYLVQLIPLHSKSLPPGFAVCLGLSISNAGSVLEWCIAFIFTFYIASFFIDLRPAVHTRHKVPGTMTEMQVESNDTRSQRQENHF